jgi:hypothetical protein
MKNQNRSPMRATTIRTATKKKMTIAILLGYGGKKEARYLGRQKQVTGLRGRTL